MKLGFILKLLTALLAGCALAMLAGCASPAGVTVWQKVQMQDETGQPIVGATAKMTAEVNGSERTTTIGLSDETGGFVLPKSAGSAYYFSKDGYATMVEVAESLFSAAPNTAKRYNMKGDVLIITLTKDNATHPELFDANKLWQSGVVDPIKNMPVIPVNPHSN